jgi:hypothetical protein
VYVLPFQGTEYVCVCVKNITTVSSYCLLYPAMWLLSSCTWWAKCNNGMWLWLHEAAVDYNWNQYVHLVTIMWAWKQGGKGIHEILLLLSNNIKHVANNEFSSGLLRYKMCWTAYTSWVTLTAQYHLSQRNGFCNGFMLPSVIQYTFGSSREVPDIFVRFLDRF